MAIMIYFTIRKTDVEKDNLTNNRTSYSAIPLRETIKILYVICLLLIVVVVVVVVVFVLLLFFIPTIYDIELT